MQLNRIAAIAALSAAGVSFVRAADGQVIRDGEDRKPAVRSPALNRWTGKPHEHRQEIARRLRQKARQEAKQAALSSPMNREGQS